MATMVSIGQSVQPLRVGVYGASGSAGAELLRWIGRHPFLQVLFATSRRYAGQSLRLLDPAAPDVMLCSQDEARPEDADVVFLCLPHGTTAALTEHCLQKGARVVDLSGDLRLREESLHARVYGTPRSEEVAQQAVYGLTEFARRKLKGARLISNPGCYPTCVSLALGPLVQKRLVEGVICVDAKSGLSGAGRTAAPHTMFATAVDDMRPYKLGREHRHVYEIEQTLGRLLGREDDKVKVIFNPHTIPVERGMLATIVLRLPRTPFEALKVLYTDAYRDEPFVEVLLGEQAAQIRMVARTNKAVIGLHPVDDTDYVVLTCAIDNLVKGAAGQAIQNMNVMMGWDETTGLLPMAAVMAA